MAKMNKDYEKLRGVSKCFTEETLKEILCIVHKGETANVSNWEFDEANAKGDNYLSTVNKIKVTGNVDGKETQVSLVVKSLPTNIGRRNTYRSVEFFRNETQFYTKMIPKFQEFLKDKGQENLLCIPRHIASCMDGENDYIAMEDVTLLGFKPLARQDCIDGDKCAMILRAMGKFHGISFAYKDQEKDFTKLVESLHETYFSDENWNWYKRFFKTITDITQNALATEYPDSTAEKRYESYRFGSLYHKAAEFCKRTHQPTSVISHGDCWAPNFLSREPNGNEILMLDFQLTRCSSPILDISTCIYACTDKTVWDEQFHKLLKIYYDELCNTITLLGSNPENLYSWNTFMSEVKEQFGFGAIFAMEIIPLSLLDESDTFDLDAIIKDDNAVDIADVWTISNIKSQSGRLRLANVFVHAIQNEFL
ncbi:uncharacterized protein LOC128872084 isoform X1 [Hylaeus volcanicus]|uniref:uncharacterized protein LOC128872084 isoform X1 n=1 Tax=Hylaeus volcanicus TaxID=313075 RepID=UPI0023B7B2EA|nr:uncharacterized protein LOC128872084 isoform X1 [Hylaeus volcanicus]XP_053970389.1 uncharacterized protein LOC128872084 isoform X1 [Hylaeus volcanicus]XP_053970391.1 uncharacterized protein LOC128872084 isoform X1 [Hylaeus volcanicus]XP_053970392.1 uncharacterized protein LOC128872084 isoform X1 [Hylaeus volcanicus]XP_053970393.1 uncharacterized protein LOC128872084 isoform X1 [Hylaeus volcanicus]